MKREEAVLRELNLHPLWVRRDGGEAQAAEPAAPEQAVPAEQTSPKPEAVAAVAPAAPAKTPPAPPIQAEPPAMPPPSMPAAPPSMPAAPAPVITEAPEAANAREQEIAALAWPELKTMVRECTACKLRAGCTQTVFGVGDESADWLFVGEGPGADEDAKGEPFVGQAGKLLDNMLLAIQLKRGKNVYIANIVKCRPPNNRAPEADEAATCMPYLQRQIALIQPKVIVALGKTAANALLGKDATLGSLRGRVHDYQGTPLIITYHPAYLLRTPQDKAKTWEDLKLAVSTASGH